MKLVSFLNQLFARADTKAKLALDSKKKLRILRRNFLHYRKLEASGAKPHLRTTDGHTYYDLAGKARKFVRIY